MLGELILYTLMRINYMKFTSFEKYPATKSLHKS